MKNNTLTTRLLLGKRATWLGLGLLATTVACASGPSVQKAAISAPPEAVRPATAATEPEATAAEAPPAERSLDEILSTCTNTPAGERCSLTAEDARLVCRAMSPTAAVRTFLGTRSLRSGFLTRDTDVWSTQVRGPKSRAHFDEEVLVLAESKASGGIVVSGSAVTYEALRWDGSCISLMGDEITFRRPPLPVRSVDLDRLASEVQTALLGNPSIRTAAARVGTACSDSTARRCDLARRELGRALVGQRDAIRL